MRKHYPRPPDQLSLQQQAENKNHPRSDWCFGCWWRDVDDVPLLHCFELGLWLINVFFIYSADYFLNQWISFSFKWNPRMILIFFFLTCFMRWSELGVDFTSAHHPMFLLPSSFLTSFIFHYLCQGGCVCTSACLFVCHQDYRKKKTTPRPLFMKPSGRVQRGPRKNSNVRVHGSESHSG